MMARVHLRTVWGDRLMEVALEHEVALTAKSLLQQTLQRDPSLTAVPDKSWTQADARRWAARLDMTYFIRMLAVFEQGLRDYWRTGLSRSTESPVKSVIDALASRLRIPAVISVPVHEVREHRNQVVHDATPQSALMSLVEAQSRLGKLIGRLPLDWRIAAFDGPLLRSSMRL